MITEIFPILSTPDLGRARFLPLPLGRQSEHSFPQHGWAARLRGVDVGPSHIGVALEPAVVDAPRAHAAKLPFNSTT